MAEESFREYAFKTLIRDAEERRLQAEAETRARASAMDRIGRAALPVGFRTIREKSGYDRVTWARALGYEHERGNTYISEMELGRKKIGPHAARLAVLFDAHGVPAEFLAGSEQEKETHLAPLTEAEFTQAFEFGVFGSIRAIRAALNISREQLAEMCSRTGHGLFGPGTIADVEKSLASMPDALERAAIAVIKQECKAPSARFLKATGIFQMRANRKDTPKNIRRTEFQSFRASLKLNQSDFATLIGYDNERAHQYISLMECGRMKVPPVVYRLANMLHWNGIPAGWL